jgi:hypothetical protein
MKKIVDTELLEKIVNSLVVMSGLPYIQIQGLIDQINKCPNYEKDGTKSKPNP